MYELEFSRAARNFLRKIKDKNLIAAFDEAFNKIESNPYIGTLKVGDLQGIYGYDFKYVKINYEIAYRICEESNKLVIIILTGTRENFYDELKRLIK